MIYKLTVKRWLDDSLSIISKEETSLKVKQEWYPVRVSWNEDTIEDAIQAINKEHALKRAEWNWETASKIEVL
jgi:hypothetical protein